MVDAPNEQQRRHYVGVLLLLSVVIIWVSSSFAMNGIFGALQYDKPFLVTYLNTATFSFYLLLVLARRQKSKRPNAESLSTSSPNNVTYVTLATEDGETTPSGTEKLDVAETAKLACEFCILWFIANYTTNASLAYTSVGSSTIIASMSGLFTLIIGSVFGVELMSRKKVIAIFISIFGVVLVSYSDHGKTGETIDHRSPLLGDFLALLGAVFYGFYTTLLKLRIGNEDRIDLPFFFGLVGVFNVLFLWPAIPILHYLGIETFELPPSSTVWIMIILNALIGTFLSDYLWLLAMLMTSPLVVTLGIALTTPLALIGDVIFKHIIPEVQYALGAILVVVGFFAINIATLKDTLANEDQYRRISNSEDEN